jgi:hypothetical protein
MDTSSEKTGNLASSKRIILVKFLALGFRQESSLFQALPGHKLLYLEGQNGQKLWRPRRA